MQIKEILDSHAAWVRGDKGGIRAILPGSDWSYTDTLSGRCLAFTNLSGANFSGADLSGADFSGANLSGADFRNADLIDTTFNSAAGTACRAGVKGAIPAIPKVSHAI